MARAAPAAAAHAARVLGIRLALLRDYPDGALAGVGDDRLRDDVLRAAEDTGSQAVPTSVLWRRLELLGDVEHLRWLRRPSS